MTSLPASEQQLPPVAVLLDLIDELRDIEPCRYDHHGYCQEHWWFHTEPACPHARAAQLFATLNAEETES